MNPQEFVYLDNKINSQTNIKTKVCSTKHNARLNEITINSIDESNATGLNSVWTLKSNSVPYGSSYTFDYNYNTSKVNILFFGNLKNNLNEDETIIIYRYNSGGSSTYSGLMAYRFNDDLGTYTSLTSSSYTITDVRIVEDNFVSNHCIKTSDKTILLPILYKNNSYNGIMVEYNNSTKTFNKIENLTPNYCIWPMINIIVGDDVILFPEGSFNHIWHKQHIAYSQNYNTFFGITFNKNNYEKYSTIHQTYYDSDNAKINSSYTADNIFNYDLYCCLQYETQTFNTYSDRSRDKLSDMYENWYKYKFIKYFDEDSKCSYILTIPYSANSEYSNLKILKVYKKEPLYVADSNNYFYSPHIYTSTFVADCSLPNINDSNSFKSYVTQGCRMFMINNEMYFIITNSNNKVYKVSNNLNMSTITLVGTSPASSYNSTKYVKEFKNRTCGSIDALICTSDNTYMKMYTNKYISDDTNIKPASNGFIINLMKK